MRETLWQRLTRGARRLRQQSDWAVFAGSDWPDRIMGVPVTDRFHSKQGRSTGRWILRAEKRHLAVYLKRHYWLPLWRGLLAALWPNAGLSPGLREWRQLEWARDHGMLVPRALAAAEYIGPWGRLQSFLAVEELGGMVPLHEAVTAAERNLGEQAFLNWKRTLVIELARIARALHERRYFHKDFYLCHFFIPEDATWRIPNWRACVYVIDLHRLGQHRRTWPLWQVKDLAQLLYSSEIKGIDARDRVRFWRAYWGANRHGRLPRLMKSWVLYKWRRYRRHNLKNRDYSRRA